MDKPKKSSKELATIITSRLNEATNRIHIPPLLIARQSADRAGRTWAVLDPGATPEIRAIVDGVRDEFDLED